MKKLLITLTLILISTSAMAEWEYLGSTSADNGFNIFTDLSSIRKTANGFRMWALFDYKTRQVSASGDKYLSNISLHEFDCKDEKTRILTFAWYSDNMGKGNVVFSNRDISTSWAYISPRTVDEQLYKTACGIN
jgi:hypothetical protein